MNDYSTKQTIVYIVAILAALAVVVGIGLFAYTLTLDSRDRKQQKIEQCIDEGYGGMVELSDNRSFVCTGGGVERG